MDRTSMFLTYGFILILVHISTNGFRTNAPIVYAAPMISLCVMTAITRMRWDKKVATIGSFASIAIGVYYWALLPKHIIARAGLFCISHGLYLYTFFPHVRKLWTPLAVVTVIYAFGLIYYAVGDLFRSLPSLCFAVALDLITVSFSMITAGSFWKNGARGNKIFEARNAAMLRFIGTGVQLVLASLLMFNHFLSHNNFHQYMLFYYIAQYLMFVANEQTF
uniref:lysoplasmalogenase n=1 Tax=Panagrellus redivivus TaxID=6233 RepID=A0A7E4VR88_PANRE